MTKTDDTKVINIQERFEHSDADGEMDCYNYNFIFYAQLKAS